MSGIDSPGAISGLVIGLVVAIALAVSLIFACYHCRRRYHYASNALDLEAVLTEGGPGILPISSHASSAQVDSQEDVKRKKKSKGIRVKGKTKGLGFLGMGGKEDDLKPSAHFAAEEDIEMQQISTVKGSRQVAPPSGMMIGGQGDKDAEERPSQPAETKGKTMLQRWLDTLPISMDNGEDTSAQAQEVATRPLISSEVQRSAVATFSPSKGSTTVSLGHLFRKFSGVTGSGPRGIAFHQLPPSRPQSLVAASSVGGEGSVVTTRSRAVTPSATPSSRPNPLCQGSMDDMATSNLNARAGVSSSVSGGGVAFSRIHQALPSLPSRFPSLPPLDEEQVCEDRDTGGRSLISPHTNESSYQRSSSHFSLGSNWLAQPPAEASFKR